MSIPNRIFVGDLARALEVIGDDDEVNWPAVAALLGFRFELARDPDTPREAAEAVVTSPVAEATRRTSATLDPHSTTPAGDIGELLEFEIERSTAPVEPIPFGTHTPPSAEGARPATPPPLFNSLWERGVLLEAIGTAEPEGDLAIGEAVQLIARGEGWRDFPFEKVQSVSKGCQILVDTGLGMQPFVGDARRLVRSVRNAVGVDHVQVLTFVDCPTRGVLSETYNDEPFCPPNSGATVIAVTDLCGGGPRTAIREAEPEAWLQIAKRVRDVAGSFVVLNPYPPHRWPASLVHHIPIVHWHATTRAVDARRARRRFGRGT